MDGFVGIAGAALALDPVASSVFEIARRDPADHPDLSLRRLDDLATLIVTKSRPGVSETAVAWLRELLAQAADGRLGKLKFLVLDFAHAGAADPSATDSFDALVGEVADLILKAPIVTIAHSRSMMAGADLELALACSMILADGRGRFSFADDPITSMAAYGFLTQKIGFVRAERLMEAGEVLDARQMHELLLVKAVMPDGLGAEGVRHYLQPALRRHNSCYGIYRAHRMAAPVIRKRPAA